MSLAASFTYMWQVADTEQLSLSGSAANSAVAPVGAEAVRLYTSEDAWVRIGAGVTAVANTAIRLTGGSVEYFRVVPGQRVSVIQAATGGTVDVTWMA